MATISTRVVVDAAGGQAREVALLAGVDVPVKVFRLEAMVTEPVEPFLRPAVSSPAIMGYCHQTTRGEFVGGTEPDVPVPCDSIRSSLEGARDMATKFVRLFPALAGVRMMRHWSGVVTQTADVAPILCEAPELRRSLPRLRLGLRLRRRARRRGAHGGADHDGLDAADARALRHRAVRERQADP